MSDRSAIFARTVKWKLTLLHYPVDSVAPVVQPETLNAVVFSIPWHTDNGPSLLRNDRPLTVHLYIQYLRTEGWQHQDATLYTSDQTQVVATIPDCVCVCVCVYVSVNYMTWALHVSFVCVWVHQECRLPMHSTHSVALITCPCG